ncbi:MAG: acyl--CoA ligase [Chloroflexi bacterium]|nr:acyl--CoA ligase [Chloroflexota bacterium]
MAILNKTISWQSASGCTVTVLTRHRRCPIPKRPLTVFLDSAAKWLPKNNAVIFYNFRLTYQQLNEQVNRFAYVLHGKGVQPGDRVMIVLPNMPQIIIAFYATLKVGGVVVMPNPDADAELITRQAVQTMPKVMVTLKSFGRLAQAIKERSSVEQFIFADIQPVVSNKVYKALIARWQLPENQPEDNAIVRAIGERMGVLMADAPVDAPPVVDIGGDDLAAILFTSGTSDTPQRGLPVAQ